MIMIYNVNEQNEWITIDGRRRATFFDLKTSSRYVIRPQSDSLSRAQHQGDEQVNNDRKKCSDTNIIMNKINSNKRNNLLNMLRNRMYNHEKQNSSFSSYELWCEVVKWSMIDRLIDLSMLTPFLFFTIRHRIEQRSASTKISCSQWCNAFI